MVSEYLNNEIKCSKCKKLIEPENDFEISPLNDYDIVYDPVLRENSLWCKECSEKETIKIPKKYFDHYMNPTFMCFNKECIVWRKPIPDNEERITYYG